MMFMWVVKKNDVTLIVKLGEDPGRGVWRAPALERVPYSGPPVSLSVT